MNSDLLFFRLAALKSLAARTGAYVFRLVSQKIAASYFHKSCIGRLYISLLKGRENVLSMRTCRSLSGLPLGWGKILQLRKRLNSLLGCVVKVRNKKYISQKIIPPLYFCPVGGRGKGKLCSASLTSHLLRFAFLPKPPSGEERADS